MAARAPVDSLDAALTDLERLTEVLDNPASSLCRHDDIVVVLLEKEFENIKLRSMVTLSNSTIANLKRLGDLYDRLSFFGEYGLDTKVLSEPAFQIVALMSASHTTHTGSEPDSSVTELQKLKDLEHWIAIISIAAMSLPEASRTCRELDHIISYDSARLQPFVADEDCDRPTLLEMLELSVKIRTGLTRIQVKSKDLVAKSGCLTIFEILDELIADIIGRLQDTKSVLVSSTHSQGSCHNHLGSASKNINGRTFTAEPPQGPRAAELPQDPNVLKDQMQGLRSKIKELEAELSATEYDKQAITRDNERFQGLIHQLEQENGRSERALINGQQLSAMLSDSAEKDKEAYEKSQAEVLQGKELLAETEKEKDGLLRTLDELRGENSQWTKEIARTSITINSLIEEKMSTTNAAADEIEVLRVDKAALAALVETTRDDLGRCEEELADAKKGLKLSNGLPESADAALDAITSNIDKVTADNVRLETELDNVKKALKQLRSSQKTKKIAGLNQSITELKKELEEANETINSFQVSSQETGSENSKLAEENIRLNNDLETATTKVDELTANNAYLKQGMADIQNKQDRIPLPQKDICDLEQQVVRTIDALNKSHIHQKECETRMKKLSASNSHLQIELVTATELVEELTAEKSHLEDHITELKDTDQKRYDKYVAELQRNECSRLESLFEAATESLEKVRADNACLKEELAASQSIKNLTWFSDYATVMLDSMKQFESRLGEMIVTREAAYARADELTHENLELKKDLAFALDKHTNQSASNDVETATGPSNAHGTTISKIDAIDDALIIEEDQEPYSDSDSWSLEEATPASSSGNSH